MHLQKLSYRLDGEKGRKSMVYIKYFIRISRNPDRTDFAEETYKTNSIFEAISTFRSHHSDKKKYVIYDFGYKED